MQPARHRSGSGPLRILIVDEHEVFRAACAALLRTEGFAVADIAPGGDVMSLAQTLEPEIVLIAASPQGARVHEATRQLRSLACAPKVLVTSSTEREQLDLGPGELTFLAKADICARAILRAVSAGRDEPPLRAESE
jgi:CheY-like chemotaxis protein